MSVIVGTLFLLLVASLAEAMTISHDMKTVASITDSGLWCLVIEFLAFSLLWCQAMYYVLVMPL